MSEDLPTNEAKDIVTCILTLEKFCKGKQQGVKVWLTSLTQLAPAGQCCTPKSSSKINNNIVLSKTHPALKEL